MCVVRRERTLFYLRHFTRSFKRSFAARATNSPTDYCVDLVKRHDHENFLCSLLLPKEERTTSFAVRAFNIEVSQAAGKSRERNVTLMRLQWWKDELENIYSGTPSKQPVAFELSKVVKKHNLLKRQLSRLLEARMVDIETKGFESLTKMEKYAEESVSPIYYLLFQSSGLKSVEADHTASHLGKAQGLTILLRSLPHHISNRQLPLPRDLLADKGVSQEEIFRYGGQLMSDVVYEIASTANSHLNKAKMLVSDVPKNHRSILLPIVPTSSYLENLRESNFDVFSPGLHERNPKLGLTLFMRKLTGIY